MNSTSATTATATPAHLVVAPGGGEELRFLGGSTMRLKASGAQTGGSLGFYEYISAPGTKGAPQHIHHGHDETFYVVEGRYEFFVGASTLVAEPGAFVYVPRGTPHAFVNRGTGPGRIVGTFTPARFGDYFRELADLMDGAGTPPGHDAWVELYARYDTTFADG